MEQPVCCYVYAHTEENPEWRLIRSRGTDCREGMVKPVFHHVKCVNRFKCNTTSQGALQTTTEGHTITAGVTCTSYLNTRKQ